MFYTPQNASFFELRVAFLSRPLRFAISEETLDSKNGTFGHRLTRHRVKFSGPFKLFSQYGALFVEIGQLNILIVHPITQSLVSDKLSSSDRVVDDPILRLFTF